MTKTRMSWMGHSWYDGEKQAYRVLVGKREGMRSLGRQRHRLEDNIEVEL